MMHDILCFGLFFGPFVSGQLTDTAVYLTVFLYFHRRMFCSNEYTLLIKTSVLQMPFEKQTQRRGAQTWKRNRVIWVVYARTQRCDSLNCVLRCFFFFGGGVTQFHFFFSPLFYGLSTNKSFGVASAFFFFFGSLTSFSSCRHDIISLS